MAEMDLIEYSDLTHVHPGVRPKQVAVPSKGIQAALSNASNGLQCPDILSLQITELKECCILEFESPCFVR